MTGPDHARFDLLVQADHDGELGVAEAASLAAHLETCAQCRALRDDLARLSTRLRAELPRFPASAALRAQLQADLMPAPVVAFRRRAPSWRALGLTLAGATALAASVTLWLPQSTLEIPRSMPALDWAVADHIRALQPGHLTDVVSTDQHTVKPWFDGRIDYAPPVRDFAAAGFPLIGGRLDYLAGRPVAALVYRRDKHIIDLFIWPFSGQQAPRPHERDGYNAVSWAGGGMQYVAVSDLESSQLRQFVTLWHGTQ